MKHLAGLLAVASLAATGCVSNTTGNTQVACQPLGETPAAPAPAWTGTVFTIVMENKSRGDIIGNRKAPYINQLVRQGAVAAGYHDAFVHPSEPNYIWMVAGQNFGILDDDDPSAHSIDSTSHLVDQLELAGLSWKSYQESMGAPCGLSSHGRYAAKHDPFVYFSDVNGWDGETFQPSQRCNDHVVDYAQLDEDLASGALPRYAFITPNLDHDMHDGSVEEGDAWLSREVPKILASDAYRHGGVLFLLWDEGGGSLFGTGDDPPFIVVSPNAQPGFVSDTDYDTSSFLMTVQKILGLPTLPCAADAKTVQSMDELFTVPLASAP